MHSEGSLKAWLAFQHVLHEPFGMNRDQLSTKLVSIGQIQVNYSTGSTASSPWQSLEAAQDRQMQRLEWTARLSSFNWFLSLAFFGKTIVGDEAFVSLHLTQTWVNSSRKGESMLNTVALQLHSQWPAGFTDPGYSKFMSAFYRMFTKSMQNEIEANSMEKSKPKHTQRQNIFSLSKQFWGDYLEDKEWERYGKHAWIFQYRSFYTTIYK